MAFISDSKIEENKQKFIELLRSIHREGARIEELINYLTAMGFFEAPASTKFHMACKGGLCEHSLNVYNNMLYLYGGQDDPGMDNLEDSIKIVGLLHDVSKSNMYVPCFRNKKVYSEHGSKSDAGGKFDWETIPGYEIREAKDRMVFGNHEQNSEYIVRCFIPLTIEEGSAILHHMGGMAFDSAKDNIGDVFNAYTLALNVYLADMISTYVNEKE